MSARLLKPFALCFAFFLLIDLKMVFSSLPGIGFWGGVSTLIFGTLFTGLGVLLGDGFRRFARPDVVIGTDGIDLFRQKVFWRIGPQLIGWIVGYIAFSGFMRNILGFAAV